MDQATVVEPHLVIDQKIVPLAGDHHVVVAVGTELGGPPGSLGDQRRDAGEQIALRLLAAEGTAHAPAFDRHGVVGHAQHDRHHVLDLARVLGRAVDRDLVVLAGDRHRDLALEIEMVLAADRHLAGEAPRRLGDRLGSIAALQGQGLGHQARLRAGQRDVEHRRQLLVFDRRQLRRPPGLMTGSRRDREQWLAGILDHPGREHRLVAAMGRADVVGARNILGGQHRDNARRPAHRIEIEPRDPCVCPGADAEIDVQQPRGLRQVVDVARLAADMLPGTVVAPGLARAAADPLRAFRHGRGSGRRPGGSLRSRRWSRSGGAATGFSRPWRDRQRSPASR